MNLNSKNESRNYLFEEIRHDLMRKKDRKVCRGLNYFQQFLVFKKTSGLEFKSHNTTKSKAMKYTIKKYCPIITRKQDKNQNQVQMKSYPNNYIQQQLKNSKEE